MKMYRFVHKEELQKMIDGDIENLGGEFKNGILGNSHHYKEGKKYLHFFLKKKSCQHIIDDVMYKKIKIDEKGFVKDFYICTFSIPINILIPRIGRGDYKSLTYIDHGYEQYIGSRVEAAIESDLFKKEWLINYEPAVFIKGVHKREIFCGPEKSR